MDQTIDLITKITLAVLLSGIVGIERQARHKIAGLRTHILVGVGSALIVLTSLHLFDIYRGVTIVDPTRMIAGIVTGIGFLCAGTIIKGGDSVIGLTTAATLWIVSGIGIAVGAGHFNAAIITTIVVYFVLTGVRTLEKEIRKQVIKKKKSNNP